MDGRGKLTITVRTVAELPGATAQPQSSRPKSCRLRRVSVEDIGVGIPRSSSAASSSRSFTTRK